MRFNKSQSSRTKVLNFTTLALERKFAVESFEYFSVEEASSSSRPVSQPSMRDSYDLESYDLSIALVVMTLKGGGGRAHIARLKLARTNERNLQCRG